MMSVDRYIRGRYGLRARPSADRPVPDFERPRVAGEERLTCGFARECTLEAIGRDGLIGIKVT